MKANEQQLLEIGEFINEANANVDHMLGRALLATCRAIKPDASKQECITTIAYFLADVIAHNAHDQEDVEATTEDVLDYLAVMVGVMYAKRNNSRN